MTDANEELQSIGQAISYGVKWAVKRPGDAWRTGKNNIHWSIRLVKSLFWGTGWVLLYTFVIGMVVAMWRYYHAT